MALAPLSLRVREFILRARRGPTSPRLVPDRMGGQRRLEVVAHCVVNALFCAARIRAQTRIHVVLDGPGAPPKSVCLDGDGMGSLPGLDEVSIWRVLRQALEAGLLL
ncbi:MAG: hypothetical protein AB1505_14140, partial [Candidatus Latescibacterota bacterium]